MLTASGQPVQIRARPHFQGKPAEAGSNPSRAYPAGSGGDGVAPRRRRAGRCDGVRGVAHFIDTAHNPTSHNLWPFEIVMGGGGLACGAVLLPGLAHKLFAAKRARARVSKKKAGVAAGPLFVQQPGYTASGQPEHALP